MNIEWKIKEFGALTPEELYQAIRLRNEVFVVEQQCVFQDADNKDQGSLHLFGWMEGEGLVAYCRILPKGLAYEQLSIGRVVTKKEARGKGIGKILMQKAMEACKNLPGWTAIRIGAQLYLLNFYQSLGFRVSGPIYLEDGIEHVEMIYHTDGIH